MSDDGRTDGSEGDRAVLDASALLALLNGERGQEVVASLMPGAVIGAVNLAEVVRKLAERGMPEVEIREALEGLALEVYPVELGTGVRYGHVEALHVRARPFSRGSRMSGGGRIAGATRLHGGPGLGRARSRYRGATGTRMRGKVREDPRRI